MPENSLCWCNDSADDFIYAIKTCYLENFQPVADNGSKITSYILESDQVRCLSIIECLHRCWKKNHARILLFGN